jgi:threonine/homoserine/homoserine lactone efflux protein
MSLVATLPPFLLAVVLISASPGPAMALIFRRAALRGFRGAVPIVLGLEAGLYLWALAAGAGLAALVAASHTAYLILRIVGAVFLVFLGIRAWRAAWRDWRRSRDWRESRVWRGSRDRRESRDRRDRDRTTPRPAPDAPQRAGYNARLAFAEGLLVQLANPKAAVFMFAFYPQFIPPGRPLLPTTALLALVQVGLEIMLYLTLAAGVSRAGEFFRRPRVRRRLEAVSGTVLIGLGLRLALKAQ